jgi:hypothetical protein
MSIQVKLENQEQLLNAIKDVRNDHLPTNWVLVGHPQNDPNTIVLKGKGDGGLEELLPQLDENQVLYALLRVTTKVDLSVTVKFVYVHHVGDKVGFASKGRYSVVHGDVVRYFQPYHVDFDICLAKELSESLIREKVERAAGNADYTRPADFAVGKPEYGKNQSQKDASNLSLNKPGSQPNLKGSSSRLYSSTENLKSPVGVVATQSQGAQLDAGMIEAIKDVRNDKSTTTWVCGAYKDGITPFT